MVGTTLCFFLESCDNEYYFLPPSTTALINVTYRKSREGQSRFNEGRLPFFHVQTVQVYAVSKSRIISDSTQGLDILDYILPLSGRKQFQVDGHITGHKDPGFKKVKL